MHKAALSVESPWISHGNVNLKCVKCASWVPDLSDESTSNSFMKKTNESINARK